MYREEGESSIDFANRVKSVIAKQGGLVDLVWDGQLKRMKPKKEWKEKQQEDFTKRLKGDWSSPIDIKKSLDKLLQRENLESNIKERKRDLWFNDKKI